VVRRHLTQSKFCGVQMMGPAELSRVPAQFLTP
jgi:hypothetical protein